MPYRFLPHTADLRVAIEADTLSGLFADALAAVRELVVGSSAVAPRETRRLALAAGEPAELVLRFFRELLFWFAADGFVPADVTFTTITPGALEAEVRGEALDPRRHEPQPEVKAVTRHGLELKQQDGGWRATLTLDV